MKRITFLILTLLITFLFVKSASAAPNNAPKALNNPNVVAYYENGMHAIPTDPIMYLEGTNIVTRRGRSGQIQAWYTGSDGHGYHSVWNISKKSTCRPGWLLIQDAYPTWGDYLIPEAEYCVKVNAY